MRSQKFDLRSAFLALVARMKVVRTPPRIKHVFTDEEGAELKEMSPGKEKRARVAALRKKYNDER